MKITNKINMIETILIVILSGFIGFYLIKNVTHSLHAPLMSITNAISSIIILGATYGFFLSVKNHSSIGIIFSLIGLFLSAVNIGGGFKISQKMIEMFSKK
jgi:H+-translocating NAD(P) transhydrogenase subunit alpha